LLIDIHPEIIITTLSKIAHHEYISEYHRCLQLRALGAVDFNPMLLYAAAFGQTQLYVSAREWGANKFDLMAERAARQDQFEACELAFRWGATNYADVLLIGAHRGEARTCRIVWAHGAIHNHYQ
jgi:hypothetical protein